MNRSLKPAGIVLIVIVILRPRIRNGIAPDYKKISTE